MAAQDPTKPIQEYIIYILKHRHHVSQMIMQYLTRHNTNLQVSVLTMYSFIFISHYLFAITWRPSSVVYRQSSVNISHFNLLLWHPLAKWTETWSEASMEGPLYRLHILSRSVKKHGRHRQFLFLIGRFLTKSSPLKQLCQMNPN